MTPKVKLSIILGVIIYISLSIYHWSQDKELPGETRQAAVKSVLKRNEQEKTWVQVSTNPARTKEAVRPAEPAAGADESNPPATPANAPPAQEPAATGEAADLPPDELKQDLPDKNNELQKPGHREQELLTQIFNLQSALNEANARLEEATAELDDLRNRQTGDAVEPEETLTDAEYRDRIQLLKSSLASRLAALEKANSRITALAERLDQHKLTLFEAESTNRNLQRMLAEAESVGTRAQQEADRLGRELIRANDDKENYLAQVGILNKQMQQAKNRLAGVESELDDAKRENEAMLLYGKEREELVTPLMQRLEILNARLEDKNSDLIDAERQIEQQQQQEQQHRDDMVALQATLAENEAFCRQLEEQFRNLDKEQKQAGELLLQLKALQEQLDAKDSQIKDLKQQMKEAESNALNDEAVKAETAGLRQELDSARQSLARMQETATRLESVNAEKEQLSATLEQQRILLATAQQEARQAATQLDEKDRGLAEAAKALQTSQAALKDMENKSNTTVETEKALTDAAVTELKTALTASQENLAKAEAEIHTLKQNLEAARQKQAEDNTAAAQLQETLDQLKTTMTELEQQQQAQQQQITALNDDNTQLRGKLNAAEQENGKPNEAAAGQGQKDQEIATQNRELAVLRADLEQSRTGFSRLQTEYEALRDQFEKLRKERDALQPLPGGAATTAGDPATTGISSPAPLPEPR